MKIHAMLMLLAASISLGACSSMGNVVPRSGPTMEQIYDGMGDSHSSSHSPRASSVQPEKLSAIRQRLKGRVAMQHGAVAQNAAQREFKKLPNPGLAVYIYPHFAGRDQVPVPGYYTEISGFDRNHYVLADNH